MADRYTIGFISNLHHAVVAFYSQPIATRYTDCNSSLLRTLHSHRLQFAYIPAYSATFALLVERLFDSLLGQRFLRYFPPSFMTIAWLPTRPEQAVCLDLKSRSTQSGDRKKETLPSEFLLLLTRVGSSCRGFTPVRWQTPTLARSSTPSS